MSNPAISLVMPVYNVENFLSKALTSVENQTFKDFEMIIVDDGSSDKSYEIAKEFCGRNPNFKLIKQKNSGPAAARNTGVTHCKGDYIAFMDSDDYLEKKFLEELYNLAQKTGADITCCNFNMYYPNKNLRIYMPFNSLPGVYTKSKALRKLILDVSVHYFIWNKLYKREKINFNFSQDFSIGEDLLFNLEYFKNCDKIKKLKKKKRKNEKMKND